MARGGRGGKFGKMPSVVRRAATRTKSGIVSPLSTGGMSSKKGRKKR